MYRILKQNREKTIYVILFTLIIAFSLLVTVAFKNDQEIKNNLSEKQPYGDWIKEKTTRLDQLNLIPPKIKLEHSLLTNQQIFGKGYCCRPSNPNTYTKTIDTTFDELRNGFEVDPIFKFKYILFYVFHFFSSVTNIQS